MTVAIANKYKFQLKAVSDINGMSQTLHVLQVYKEDIKSNNGQNFFQVHKINNNSSHFTTDNGRMWSTLKSWEIKNILLQTAQNLVIIF